MVHYKSVKVTINTLRLMKIIINMVMRYHIFPDSIISDRGVIFIC